MAIYYTSPAGNDSTGTGTVGNPWKTVSKATSTVTTVGDTIHLLSGIYLETVQCFLAAGVNMEGETDMSSIFQSTWPWAFQGGLCLDSPEGSNGNQSLSYITFDGRGELSERGIEVYGRSNINIHHLIIKDYNSEGIVISATVGYTGFEPAIYAVNNLFHDNVVTNCSQYAGYGTGCVGIGGQQDMLFYNNTITQNLRAGIKQIGWPVKYFNEGWFKGLKIYNNTVTKAPWNGQGWNFAFELFNNSGVEIYNNTIQGSLDFNFQNRRTYPYSVSVHDNVITQPAFNTHTEDGVIIEYSIDGLYIENNIFKNLSNGVAFYTRENASISNVFIRKNLFANFGVSGEGVGGFIGGFGNGASNYSVSNFVVDNNTFYGIPGNKPYSGCGFGNCQVGSISNVFIRNNHFDQIQNVVFSITGAVTADNVVYSHNNTQNITYFQTQFDHTPTNYTSTPNYTFAPSFIGSGNFTLLSSSLLIDAGMNIGLPYSGSNPDIGYSEFASGNATPSVSAGSPQTITLPTSTVTLVGSASDSDGTIASVLWSKLSGPAGQVIVSPSAQTTVVNNLSAGTYIFQLLATDNLGGIGTSTVTITVNPVGGPNNPPTANAGVDQSITLPTNIVTLAGSGSDPGGSIASYLWSKQSGSVNFVITNPTSANTTITGLTAGIYIFRLTVTDNLGATGFDDIQITVNGYSGGTPAVYAGLDQSITLPTNSVNLTSNSATPAGTGVNYVLQSGNLSASPWSPGGGTTITTDQANDLDGNLTLDMITCTTSPGGVDQIVSGLIASTTYYVSFDVKRGTGGDAMYYVEDWDHFQVLISDTSYFSLTGNTVQRLQFSFTTPAGCTTIKLRPFANNFSAGTIYLGRIEISPNNNDNYALTTTTAVTSGGAGTTIVSRAWTKFSGPSTFTITTPTTANTSVTGLVAGTYIFRITVTDSLSATASDDVQVVVNAAIGNIPPVVNAGPNQNIILPTSSVTMAGSATDSDGTVTSHTWTQFSGPNTATITTPSSYTTTITGLIAGGYVFRLSATDNNSATSTADMLVSVTPVPPAQTLIHRKAIILP